MRLSSCFSGLFGQPTVSRCSFDPQAEMLGQYIGKNYGCTPESLAVLSELKSPDNPLNRHPSFFLALSHASKASPALQSVLFERQKAIAAYESTPVPAYKRSLQIANREVHLIDGRLESDFYTAINGFYNPSLVNCLTGGHARELRTVTGLLLQYRPAERTQIVGELQGVINNVYAPHAQPRASRFFASVINPPQPAADSVVIQLLAERAQVRQKRASAQPAMF